MSRARNAPVELSSDLLAEIGPEVSRYIIDCAKSTLPLPSVLGSELGSRLYTIAGHLKATEPFHLPAQAEELSGRALRDLLEICKVLKHYPLQRSSSTNLN